VLTKRRHYRGHTVRRRSPEKGIIRLTSATDHTGKIPDSAAHLPYRDVRLCVTRYRVSVPVSGISTMRGLCRLAATFASHRSRSVLLRD
jgi:hypothetical protein